MIGTVSCVLSDMELFRLERTKFGFNIRSTALQERPKRFVADNGHRTPQQAWQHVRQISAGPVGDELAPSFLCLYWKFESVY
jgi:hypothetical protein